MSCSADDALADSSDGGPFVGYNEWAARTLGVTIATDFVYDEQPPHGDRAVFIAEDIAPHTEVFAIPLQSLLTVRSVHETPSLALLAQLPFFQQCDPEREDDQLAIALLYELYVTRDASKWSEHLALLPTTYDNVLYFSDTALQLLQGSNVFFVAEQMKRKVATDYEALQHDVLAPLFDALLAVERDGDRPALTQAYFTESFSLERYKWALSTIWSRFVSLHVGLSDDAIPSSVSNMSRVKAMVPVFDMLNHDPDAEMLHVFDIATQQFRLVSHQHWAAGAQLCINYGALSNQKLLTLYGFVVDPNPSDALDVWMPMDVERTTWFDEKAELLAANGLDHEATPFELTADADDGEPLNELLLIAVRIQEIECATREEFDALVARALDGDVLSAANERAVLTRLIFTLECLLSEYGEDDDEEEDGEEDDEEDGSDADAREKRHRRMALVVRRSDMAILASAIEQLKWKLLAFLPVP